MQSGIMLPFFLLGCIRRILITFGLVFLLFYAAYSQTVPAIYWYAPEDGGTPRNPERIIKTSPSDFIILAAPLMSPLPHAVSRVNLICRNESARPDTLTVKFDVSGDNTRTNFNDNQFGGMPKRDYIYIRPPGELWQRVNGYTDDWKTIVSFAAKPGETLVGLAPWYTYQDYIMYVHSLTENKYLRKRMVGRSDLGREHWMIIITDPDVPSSEKESFLWYARKHCYETFSSFSIEGIVEYLLSDEGDEARKKYVFNIIPMINIDGVAQGYEYRGGYDMPDVTTTASGRLHLQMVDETKPDYLVDWHNWGQPRDMDRFWYTYKLNGEPHRYGWDVFTQHYPSPRCTGHSWQYETEPIRVNTLVNRSTGKVRTSFNEDDPEGRAMKLYGANQWGWEKPWWGRDEGDPVQNARDEGSLFCRVLLETIEILKQPIPSGYYEPSSKKLKLGESFELKVSGTLHVDNPECGAAVVGEFTNPSGETEVFEGIFEENNTWLVKFKPDAIGEWKYIIRGEGVEIFQTGIINCKK
ncbi:DUF5060 domain-containing protein [Bacteroidota bacterium]